MSDTDNKSNASIFNAWQIFSKLYNAVYCSRGSGSDQQATKTSQLPTPYLEHNSIDLNGNPEAVTQVPQQHQPRQRHPSQPEHIPDKTCLNENSIDIQNAAVVVEDGIEDLAESEFNNNTDVWFDAVNNENVEKVQELVEKHFNVDNMDEHGWSALHIASWNNYLPLCQLLLTSGADVNSQGPSNATPLSLASQHGHIEIVKILIHSQCNIMQTSNLGDTLRVTALHLAAQNGHSEVVKLLIESGAIVNAAMMVRGIDGVTPLHLAVENEHLDVMDILISAGCDVQCSTQPDANQVTIDNSVC